MSWGFKGPIGRGQLETYALSRCFQILALSHNVQICRCKGCGDPLDRGDGRLVMAITIQRQNRACYFCQDCLKPIMIAIEKFPPSCWIDGDPPAWWLRLTEKVKRSKRNERQQLSRDELERMIQERERLVTPHTQNE